MEFKEIIQKIKNEYNIVDYIKLNGVDLKPGSNGNWVGLCPFHTEKTPSFTVSEDFQNYKCFGCGESGDILSFAQHTHTIEFVEAMKMLAEEKGIEITNKVSKEDAHDINAIRQVISDAQKFFRANYEGLDNTHPAKQQVIKRQLDENNELYGYALEGPNELYKYLKSKGHSDKDIKDSNLVIFFEDGKDPWDFFHGRLMITLNDYLGRPVSFTARKIYEDDKMPGKYVNGRESPVFHKKGILFGADIAKKKAREEKTIYVVEGQFDQIAMFENGLKNVVATSGTAFTSQHANLLLRMVGDSGRIIFIMDGDEAGIEAAIKIFTIAKELHSNSHAVLLGNGKDPCDYIKEGGIDLLKKTIDNSVPLHDFVINATLKKAGGSITSDNRHGFVSEIAKYAKSAENSFIVDNMLSKASVLTAMSISNVREIYDNIKENKTYVKKEEIKQDKLNPKIKMNMNNEADVCMYSALALLVRMPEVLVELTPKQIHKKFHTFMRELGKIYSKTKRENRDWRFIPEDYSDPDFAKALQEKTFLYNPKDDVKSTSSQYVYLFNRANDLYAAESEKLKLARAFSSIVDSTDAKEIAKMLKMYEGVNTTHN